MKTVADNPFFRNVTLWAGLLMFGKEAKRKMEAPGGLEPPIEILQTSALPLGDGALHSDEKYGAGEGIRTLDLNLGKVALYH